MNYFKEPEPPPPQPKAQLQPPAPVFNPYVDNGGTIVAIKVDGAVVVGSDTRLIEHHLIHTRNQPKLFNLTNKTILATTGCWTDCLNIVNMMRAQTRKYRHETGRDIGSEAAASYLSNLIYSRRVLLPYRSSNIIAGLDDNNEGYICAFDGLGHRIVEPYAVGGSAQQVMVPILDSQLTSKTENGVKRITAKVTKEEASLLVKDCFIIAADRDLFTGDGAIIKTLSAEGVTSVQFKLRED